MKEAYLVFDGRACGGVGADDATCLVSCQSLKEARSYNGDYGQTAIYKYDIVKNTLENEE